MRAKWGNDMKQEKVYSCLCNEGKVTCIMKITITSEGVIVKRTRMTDVSDFKFPKN